MPSVKIADLDSATAYLREHYRAHSVAGTLPVATALGAQNGHYRFAVYWPHNGRRAVVNVGPRGGLFTSASFSPSEWRALQKLWPPEPVAAATSTEGR